MCKKLTSLGVCAGLLLGLFAGCSGSPAPESAATPPGGVQSQTGRYIELDITPPEADGVVIDLVAQGDDIRLLTMVQKADAPIGDYLLHISADGGESWQSAPQTWFLPWCVDTMEEVGGKRTGERTFVSEQRIIPGGGMTIYLSNYSFTEGNTAEGYYLQDAAGNAGPLQLAAMQQAADWPDADAVRVDGVYPVAPGLITAVVQPQVYDADNGFYSTDPAAPVYRGLFSLETGELLAELPEWDGVAPAGDGFVLRTPTGGSYAFGFDGQPLPYTPVDMARVALWGSYDANGAYYSAGRQGLLRQPPSGPPEQIMGTAGTFASPLYSAQHLRMQRAGEYVVAYTASQGGVKLKRYVYDETAGTNSGSLAVFALRDSDSLRQAIHLFSVANPGVEVMLELLYDKYGVPLDPNSTLAEEDVLRDLALRLLAGTGPDVLLLDGLPLQSYIAQDALLDVSGLLEDMGLAPQLIDPLRDANGALYAVPARFSVPMAVAQGGDLASFASLDALAGAVAACTPALVPQDDYTQEQWDAYNSAQKERSYDDMPLLTFANPDEVVNALLDTSLPALYLDGGVLDGQALLGLITAAGQIVENRGLTSPNIAVRSEPSEMEGGKGYCQSLTRMQSGEAHAAYFPFTSFEYLADIAGGFKPREGFEGPTVAELTLLQLPGLCQGVYKPVLMAGIYSGSQQQALAAELVTALLSPDTQQWEFYDGLPVNNAAMNTALALALQRYNKTEQVAFQLETFLQGLTTPVLPDTVLRTAVCQRANEYFAGALTAQQAVDAVLQDTALYFAEHDI